MKKALLLLGLILLCSPAYAQVCDSTSKETLRQCVFGSVAACAAATTNCTIEEHAFTIQDVEDTAVEVCCDKSAKSDKKATKKRRNCLKKQKRFYSSKRARPLPREFRDDAKEVIDALRDSDCNNNAYANLF